jgi:NTE family protein
MEAEFVIAVDLNANLVGRYARAPKNGVPSRRPGMIDVLTSSLNIMSERITRSRLAGEPAEIVIQPRLAEMGLLEYHRGSEAIAEGRAAAEIMIPHLKRMLDEA